MHFTKKPRFTIKDLAARWNLDRKTIASWANGGKLPARHCIGSVRFWTHEQIEAWEELNILKAEEKEIPVIVRK